MIKRFKELAWVIGLLLIAAVFIFIRSANKNRFSGTTENLVETLKNEPVFVHPGNLQTSDYLLVEIGNNTEKQFAASISVSFNELTDKEFRSKLESAGKKILLTGDESHTAKAWVILNQLGIENLFILSEKEKPESLRHTFIPDTSKTAVASE